MEVIRRAYRDTLAFFGLSFGRGGITVLMYGTTFSLLYWWLGKDKAMEELSIIVFGLASGLIVFTLIFLWNLWLAPYRITSDKFDDALSALRETPSPWRKVADFRSYDGYVDFELYEVACLWVGIEPHHPVQHPEAKKMLGQLRSAVRNHALSCPEISLFALETPKDSSPIRRDDLLDYSAAIGDIPEFLAQEEG